MFQNKSYHDTTLDYLSAKHKGGLESVDVENGISAHGVVMALTGNPLERNWFLSDLLILCLPVHENHKHVQCWKPTTTTSFP